MSMEHPSSPEAAPASSGPKKRTILDRVFQHLPAGSRRIAGAMGIGAMEMLSDNVDSTAFQKANRLSQANDLVHEQKKERRKRALEAEEVVLRTEKLDEIRKKIRNGSQKSNDSSASL